MAKVPFPTDAPLPPAPPWAAPSPVPVDTIGSPAAAGLGLPQDPASPAASPAAGDLPAVVQAKARRKRSSQKVDKDAVVAHVLARLEEDLADRDVWLRDYLQTYARYRGWFDTKDWPWQNAANAHLPVTMYNCQRLASSLLNAVLAHRPIMAAQAWKSTDQAKQDRIDAFLDWQIMVEMAGEKPLSDWIHNFVVDDVALAYIPWVRERGQVTDVRVVSGIPSEGPQQIQALESHLRAMVPELLTVDPPDPANPHVFTFNYLSGRVLATGNGEVFDRDDGRVDLLITRTATQYDGPSIQVKAIEDVVVPSHADNCQPRGAQNRTGAAHMATLDYLTVDEITRKQRSGEWDLLSAADVKTLKEGTQETDQRLTSPKALKDESSGQASQQTASQVTTHTLVTHYGKWDLDDDGLEEECIFHVLKEGKLLCKAELLSERFPSHRRPFAEARLFPEPGQFYGISMPKHLEGLADIIDSLFNQSLDCGTLANSPFFFYRPSGGLKPEIIRMNPGEGYPLDDPNQDVKFPQIPNANQAWAIQMIGLTTQFLERQAGQGDVQFGRVPTGKASALRTASTTMALLSQGDARTETILRRLFSGLAEIWAQVFALDQAFLMPGKEFRVLGMAANAEGAFDLLKTPDDIAGRFSFDFRATMLESNPSVQQEVATSLMATLASPLLLQLGIVNPEHIYNLAADYVRAHKKTEVGRYVTKPPGMEAEGPKLTAEQVVTMVMQGEMPQGTGTIEPLEIHLQKLVQFIQTGKMIQDGPWGNVEGQIGLIPPQSILLLKAYILRLQMKLMQQQQLQQMMAAAGQFQQQMGQGKNGTGGPMPGPPQIPGVGEGLGQTAPNEPGVGGM